MRDFSPRSTNDVYIRNYCIQGGEGEGVMVSHIIYCNSHSFRTATLVCTWHTKKQVNFIDETNVKFRGRCVSMISFLKEINSSE